MLLKRAYRKSRGWIPEYNNPREDGTLPNPHRAAGVLLNPPPLDQLQVLHTGLQEAQHFSERLVRKGQEEGWLTIDKGTLTIYAKPENLVYEIVRVPGRYSCYDGSKLPDDEGDTGRLARAVIAERHAGQPSPDPAHPSGYYKINYYDCRLNAAQQATFALRKGKR